MKFIQKLLNAKNAKYASRFMNWVCILVLLFHVVCLVTTFLGRQTFTLHAHAKTYNRAIYAEENHNPTSRAFTVTVYKDDVHVWTNSQNEIDPRTQIGLSIMYAISAIPLIFSLWLLSRVFVNVDSDRIFTEQNACYLLYFGILQFFVYVFAPFIKHFVCYIVNLISSSRITISWAGVDLFAALPCLAFVVAAYIIHYGIQLQDEVDHTI